jgi:predicted dehydrogenase
MQSYSAGVIGVGFIGHKSEDSHLKAYGDCERTEIQTVCDLRLPASVGDRDDFAGFHDYRDMPHLDIVSICTPVDTRRDSLSYGSICQGNLSGEADRPHPGRG